jgi:hypothetical protein
MAYISKGDLLEVNGRKALAASSDYTRLVYDDFDIECSRGSRSYEGGTAMGYVDLVYTDTGVRSSSPVSKVRKLSSIGEAP